MRWIATDEDLALFRPAGNVLANQLAARARDATAEYNRLDHASIPSLDERLPRLRRLFDIIDTDRNGYLEPDELEAAATRLEGSSIEGSSIEGSLEGHSEAAAIIREAARRCLEVDDEDGCLLAYTFADFVVRVAPTEEQDPALDSCALAASPPAAAPTEPRLGVNADEAVPAVDRSKAERFDGYVSELLSWEVAAKEGKWEGRTGELVAGCVAGARNAPLVDALRVVYCDNAILRKAGDLVFRAFLRPMRGSA